LVFFPLANYSFKSMAKMKALQPEMVRLKDLHKDDKTKLQQAMMSLYKKEQINPASGCLPVLIQIPFFFAIYKMLFISLEMRHQPFFGWIKDLSASDPTTIFNLFGLLPFTPPSFLIIGIWPILMGLTMFVQQKLNPAPTDPIQAKIFMFFPIFLTVILASFPSGLVVYWTVNNILTIAQQWFIIKRTTVKTN
jgi:YidC/Oxa1 family membrane protein insertase